MNKLVLVDGNAILHRAFHALPLLTTKRGEPINAVYGLISMLLRVITDLKPTHIAVCFDTPEPTFRNKVFKEYQAQRPPTADELSGQFEKARKVVEAFEIPIYSKAGYEADDVIGTIAQQAMQDTGILRYKDIKGKNRKAHSIQISQYPSIDEVIIVTGDKDQLQLINDKVKLYMPIAGLSSAKLYGEKETVERLGVFPSQVDDYKALVGDPSDNYPGVPGIGPKTAINLLGKFRNFENIYKNLDQIPESTANKLKAGEKSGRLSKKLATIVRNVPIEIDFEKMDDWDVDGKKVLDLFGEFGFKTLTERVKKIGKEIDEEKQMTLI
mgnify:CR=1 FL=1